MENNSQRVTAFLVSNYKVKPALLFAKKSGPDDLAYISWRIYEAVPSKIGDIKSVYSKFDPNQVSDNITAEEYMKSKFESNGTSNNTIETEVNDGNNQADPNENSTGV